MKVEIRHLSKESAHIIFNFIYPIVSKDCYPAVKFTSNDKVNITFILNNELKLQIYDDVICIESADEVCKIPRWEFSHITIV